MPGTSIDIVVNTPPKVIYEVVADFESYPEFLPDAKNVVIESSNGKGMVASFEIKVIKTIHYSLQFKLHPPKKLSWTYVKGDLFKNNVGSWEFEELKKGQTKATYSVEVDFGLFIPKAIINMLVGSNLPAMMERFKKRAETLHRGVK